MILWVAAHLAREIAAKVETARRFIHGKIKNENITKQMVGLVIHLGRMGVDTLVGPVTRISVWPPPQTWTEVRVDWRVMLDREDHNPKRILEWVEQYIVGRYHLHGWEAWDRYSSHGIPPVKTDGFAFRFEDPEDAMLFRLTWTCD